jgi:hypothetical protein
MFLILPAFILAYFGYSIMPINKITTNILEENSLPSIRVKMSSLKTLVLFVLLPWKMAQ